MNHRTHNRHDAQSRALFCAVALITATTLAPTGVLAQDSSLMKGEEVLQKWADMTGGKAREKIRNRVMNGVVELPLMHIRGPLTIYSATPANRYEVWELSAGQAYERGCDGVNVWTVRTQGGAQLLAGKAKSVALLEAAFNMELHWREYYASAETTAIKHARRLAFGDQPESQRPCYEVKMTPKDPECDPETWYIDTENFQRIAIIGKVKVGDVLIDRVVLFADYRPVNDVLEPFVVAEQIDVQKQFITYRSIQHNVRMSKFRFEMPDDVKKILAVAARGIATSAPSSRPADAVEKPATSAKSPQSDALPAKKETGER